MRKKLPERHNKNSAADQNLGPGDGDPDCAGDSSWKAGNPSVTKAVVDSRIAEALAAVTDVDEATVSNDHAAFAGLLADDLVVNHPQNGVSVRGATRQRSDAGQISYVSYDRIRQLAPPKHRHIPIGIDTFNLSVKADAWTRLMR